MVPPVYTYEYVTKGLLYSQLPPILIIGTPTTGKTNSIVEICTKVNGNQGIHLFTQELNSETARDFQSYIPVEVHKFSNMYDLEKVGEILSVVGTYNRWSKELRYSQFIEFLNTKKEIIGPYTAAFRSINWDMSEFIPDFPKEAVEISPTIANRLESSTITNKVNYLKMFLGRDTISLYKSGAFSEEEMKIWDKEIKILMSEPPKVVIVYDDIMAPLEAPNVPQPAVIDIAGCEAEFKNGLGYISNRATNARHTSIEIVSLHHSSKIDGKILRSFSIIIMAGLDALSDIKNKLNLTGEDYKRMVSEYVSVTNAELSWTINRLDPHPDQVMVEPHLRKYIKCILVKTSSPLTSPAFKQMESLPYKYAFYMPRKMDERNNVDYSECTRKALNLISKHAS